MCIMIFRWYLKYVKEYYGITMVQKKHGISLVLVITVVALSHVHVETVDSTCTHFNIISFADHPLGNAQM